MARCLAYGTWFQNDNREKSPNSARPLNLIVLENHGLIQSVGSQQSNDLLKNRGTHLNSPVTKTRSDAA